MSALHALGPAWLNPQTLVDQLGTWALWGTAAIIFAECGLLIGFFLPGDSLLFSLGLFIAGGHLHQPLWLACVVLAVAAFAGNVVGYEFGRRAGPPIVNRPGSRLFKPQYVQRTAEFFDRYGARAIILARFVPIVRTFITVVAGVARMDRRRFLTYTGIGAVLWASGVTLLGYFLGSVTFVHEHIEVMLVAIVVISVLPMVVEALRARRRAARTEAESNGPATSGGSRDREDLEPASMEADDL
jgi:membrane protein DedA with SNARE-associated domain